MDEIEAPYVAKVLDGMWEYLQNTNHGFHYLVKPAFCMACDSVGSVAGDYRKPVGSNSIGEMTYERVKSPEQCIYEDCKGTSFILISALDMKKFRDYTGERAPDILIDGIANGLEKMDFPTLYNEDLPEIVGVWDGFGDEEKAAQIRQLFELQDRLVGERDSFEKQKKAVESLEDALRGD